MAKITGVHVSGEVVGSVKAWPSSTTPTNYLLCNGAAVSRTTYAHLFAKIGTTHGQGDGSTTFNLPNYQGRFLRGVDNTAGNDPDKASRTAMGTGGNTGNAVGSVQGHAFQSHNHSIPSSSTNAAPGNNVSSTGGAVNQTSVTGVGGGNETRPINAYK